MQRQRKKMLKGPFPSSARGNLFSLLQRENPGSLSSSPFFAISICLILKLTYQRPEFSLKLLPGNWALRIFHGVEEEKSSLRSLSGWACFPFACPLPPSHTSERHFGPATPDWCQYEHFFITEVGNRIFTELKIDIMVKAGLLIF